MKTKRPDGSHVPPIKMFEKPTMAPSPNEQNVDDKELLARVRDPKNVKARKKRIEQFFKMLEKS